MLTLITAQKFRRRRQWRTACSCRKPEALSAVGVMKHNLQASEKCCSLRSLVFKNEQKEKAWNRLDYRLFQWRRVRDSNPRDGITVKLISSQPRYDHFDNSPCIFQSYFFFQKSLIKLLGRKTGKKAKNYSILNFENPVKSRISGGQN